jgi:hypothetical protein
MGIYQRQRPTALAESQRRGQKAVLLRPEVARLGRLHQRVHERHASLSVQRRVEQRTRSEEKVEKVRLLSVNSCCDTDRQLPRQALLDAPDRQALHVRGVDLFPVPALQNHRLKTSSMMSYRVIFVHIMKYFQDFIFTL